MNIREIVLQILLNKRLIPPTSRVVVGVSGGADSLALLHVLYLLRESLPHSLHAATLDHGLRGPAGADDVRFVEELAKSWDLPVTSGHVNVQQIAAEARIGIEAAARRARYDFLAGVARDVDASHVAVAHQADDQAETLLMHILRGSGLRGLAGMAWQSALPGHPDLILIRPLLAISREQVEAYCAAAGLQPREDLTNRDPTYLRNFLRAEILPALKQRNPGVERSLLRLADIARADDDYLDARFRQLVLPSVQQSVGRLTLRRAHFAALHPALQRRFMRWAAGALQPDADSGSAYEAIIHAVEVALRGQVGARAELKRGLWLRIDYETLVVEEANAPPQESGYHLLPAPDSRLDVQIPGLTTPAGAAWSLHVQPLPWPHAQTQLLITAGSTVELRARRPGDRFAPLGLHGQHQKLKNWMINRKIPRAVRGQIPLLTVDDEIAAIILPAAWAVSQHYAATQQPAADAFGLAILPRNPAENITV